MTLFLLGLIAVGVLLMTDAGKALLGAAAGLTILWVLIIIGVVVWAYYGNQISSTASEIAQAIFGIAILWYIVKLFGGQKDSPAEDKDKAKAPTVEHR